MEKWIRSRNRVYLNRLKVARYPPVNECVMNTSRDPNSSFKSLFYLFRSQLENLIFITQWRYIARHESENDEILIICVSSIRFIHERSHVVLSDV